VGGASAASRSTGALIYDPLTRDLDRVVDLIAAAHDPLLAAGKG
jgi:hypothetical protein